MAGRPTDYRPEYCDMLIEHMAKGLSFETFGARIDVHKDTLYEWTKVHPEFSDAKKRAFLKCQLHWEELGLRHLVNTTEKSESEDGGRTTKTETMNTGVWVFNMKNRFKWTDRVEVTPAESERRDLAQLSDAELDGLLE